MLWYVLTQTHSSRIDECVASGGVGAVAAMHQVMAVVDQVLRHPQLGLSDILVETLKQSIVTREFIGAVELQPQLVPNTIDVDTVCGGADLMILSSTHNYTTACAMDEVRHVLESSLQGPLVPVDHGHLYAVNHFDHTFVHATDNSNHHNNHNTYNTHTIILYSTLGTSHFYAAHNALMELCIQHGVSYVLRLRQGGVVSASSLHGGFGVQLNIKDVEYRNFDEGSGDHAVDEHAVDEHDHDNNNNNNNNNIDDGGDGGDGDGDGGDDSNRYKDINYQLVQYGLDRVEETGVID